MAGRSPWAINPAPQHPGKGAVIPSLKHLILSGIKLRSRSLMGGVCAPRTMEAAGLSASPGTLVPLPRAVRREHRGSPCSTLGEAPGDHCGGSRHLSFLAPLYPLLSRQEWGRDRRKSGAQNTGALQRGAAQAALAPPLPLADVRPRNRPKPSRTGRGFLAATE